MIVLREYYESDALFMLLFEFVSWFEVRYRRGSRFSTTYYFSRFLRFILARSIENIGVVEAFCICGRTGRE